MAKMNFPKVSPKSLRAFAIEIRNEMSGGQPTDDSRFSIRHIESEIKHLQGQVQKEIDLANELIGIMPDAQRIQIYPCIELEETNDFYCKCTKSGGRFLKVKLPSFYEWRGAPYMTYLGTVDMETPFVPMAGLSALNAFGEAIKKPSYFVTNRAAYVALPPRFALVCEVTVMGIPEDPTETTGRCFDVWNEKWPIQEYIKAAIKDRLRRSFANIMLTTSQSPDIINNAQHGNQIVNP